MSDFRICGDPNCTTILSRFNDTDYCAAHSRPRPFDAEEWHPQDNKRPYERIGGMPPRSNGSAYMKAYRSVKPEYARRNRDLTNAKSAAALIVANRHPDEFEQAFTEVCEARDIAP